MRRSTLSLALLPFVLAACSRAGAPTPAGSAPTPEGAPRLPAPPLAGLRLLWHDEFDGAALDPSRWTAYAGPRRDALNDPRAVRVGDGLLTLAVWTEGGVHSVGFIDTAGRFAATYGWFEARIRFVSAPGEWGAFWLQTPTMGAPVGDVAAAGTEIDVAEHRATDTAGTDISGRYGINLHWDGYGASHRHAGAEGAPPPGSASLQGVWHVYAVHWTPRGYTFYLDGVAQWATAEGLSRRPEFIKLTCEVRDRGWAGPIPAGGYGPRAVSRVGMQVDWIRVWQAET